MSSPRLRVFVAGATGNTGAPCVRALSASGQVDVVAMTRSASSAAARELAALPNVTLVEASYADPASLARGLAGCQRAYIACHNSTAQFQDETAFYTAVKQAGVGYVVKLATHQPFMSYTSPIFYGRTHLALEDWLEKLGLPFTSLRANFFSNLTLALANTVSARGEFPAVNKGQAIAMVNPADVGEVAAALLLLPDPGAHHSKRYVVSGPEDCSDEQLQALVEEARGPSAPKLTVVEADMSEILAPMVRSIGFSEGEQASIRLGWPLFVHTGLSDLKHVPTDPAVLALKPPRRTVRELMLSEEARKLFAPKQQ